MQLGMPCFVDTHRRPGQRKMRSGLGVGTQGDMGEDWEAGSLSFGCKVKYIYFKK